MQHNAHWERNISNAITFELRACLQQNVFNAVTMQHNACTGKATLLTQLLCNYKARAGNATLLTLLLCNISRALETQRY